MTMEEMQRQLARQQSRADIMNLMGRYQYYHTGGEMSRIGRELFAYWLSDARCEYGPLGVFGPEKSLQFFDAMTELFTGDTGACHPGLLEIHQITTPVLEVAEDNQTAKGMWMSTGAILMLHDEGAEEGRSFTWQKRTIHLRCDSRFSDRDLPYFRRERRGRILCDYSGQPSGSVD